MSVPIIGITGKKFSGKSTFATNLKLELEKRGVFPARFAFANPLKEVCHKLFGGTVDNWYGDFKTQKLEQWEARLGEKYSTPRRIMQTIGTDIFRNNVNGKFWIYVAESYLKQIEVEEAPDCIIIDDVRFDNEAELVLSAPKSTVIRVSRHYDKPQADDTHESERGVKQYNYSYSYGPLTQLQECTKDLADKLYNDGTFAG